jgi:DNA helicase HerA-like ATPase
LNRELAVFEIHVYASPLSRTLFDAPRDANIRLGDVFVVTSEEPRGAFLALVESVEGDYAHPRVHGTLTLLARLGEGARLQAPPSRPPYFIGEAIAVPQDVATNYFGVAALEQDPVTKVDLQPASLEVGRLLADLRVPVAFSAAGFSRHTVLVAQSGAGKSYGLGVILEELLARTRLRLCIIDPNGDFAPAFGSSAARRSPGGGHLAIASSRDPSVYDAAIERAERIGQRGCVLNLNTLDVGLWTGVVDKLIGTLWRPRKAHPDVDRDRRSASFCTG